MLDYEGTKRNKSLEDSYMLRGPSLQHITTHYDTVLIITQASQFRHYWELGPDNSLGGGLPVHCGMRGGIPVPHALDVSSTAPLSLDNRKCLQTWPNVPYGKILPDENHWLECHVLLVSHCFAWLPSEVFSKASGWAKGWSLVLSLYPGHTSVWALPVTSKLPGWASSMRQWALAPLSIHCWARCLVYSKCSIHGKMGCALRQWEPTR